MKAKKSLTRTFVLLIVTVALVPPSHTQHNPSRPSPVTQSDALLDSVTVVVQIRQGWNMISNPVYRAPGTDSICQIFPGAIPCCIYRWWGGYQCSYTFRNGEGGWFKFASPGIYSIGGEPISQDSILVSAGWNIIGSISYPVAVSTIITIPDGIISSPFFQYDGRYAIADTIRPGWAYWVKASSGGGKIILSSTVRQKGVIDTK